MTVKIFRVSLKLKNIRKQFLYTTLVALLAVSTSISVFAAPYCTNYSISSSYKNPSGVVTVGGLLWYAEASSTPPYLNHYIASMTTSGMITNYDISYPYGATDFGISSLVAGPDGNLWFNGLATNGIFAGSLNITTGVVNFYPSSVSGYGAPGPIVSGSDSKLWYFVKSNYAQGYSYLVSVNPSTGTTTTGPQFDSYADLTGLTSGPDGKLWLTDEYYSRVYAFNTSGSAAYGYNMPTAHTNPFGIINGPDGNLWLLESGKIAKVSTSGVFTEYTLRSGVYPWRLIAGPDGSVWFPESNSTPKIGRITSSGSVTEYSVPGTSVNLVGDLTVGPNNAMWFSYKDSGVGKIGSISTTPFFNNYAISSSYTGSSTVTKLNGLLWYAETSATSPHPNHYIASMTTSGIVTDYNILYPFRATDFGITSLVAGPDGNLWFNGLATNGIYAGTLNISTGAVTFYVSSVTGYGAPGPIVAGSDGNLWYYVKSNYAQQYSYLVSLNPTTGTTTAARQFDRYTDLSGLASGSDGRLWLTDTYYNRVYAYPTSGAGGNSYNIPTVSSYPGGIIAGPDGNLWFVKTGKVVKITTSGSFTEFTLATGVNAWQLTAGSDGAVWFTDGSSTPKIGRITGSGIVTEYTIPGSGNTISGDLVLGPDSSIWFSYKNTSGGKLGRLGY